MCREMAQPCQCPAMTEDAAKHGALHMLVNVEFSGYNINGVCLEMSVFNCAGDHSGINISRRYY